MPSVTPHNQNMNTNIGIRRLVLDTSTGNTYTKLGDKHFTLVESQTLHEEAAKTDKRITELEKQIESFEKLVADLMVTVNTLNDRINSRQN